MYFGTSNDKGFSLNCVFRGFKYNNMNEWMNEWNENTFYLTKTLYAEASVSIYLIYFLVMATNVTVTSIWWVDSETYLFNKLYWPCMRAYTRNLTNFFPLLSTYIHRNTQINKKQGKQSRTKVSIVFVCVNCKVIKNCMLSENVSILMDLSRQCVTLTNPCSFPQERWTYTVRHPSENV